MAPRAKWKGFLRLSLVTCPVALYPATSESEKVSFNQLNKQTGHRIKYVKVDADTGEEVPNEDIASSVPKWRTRYDSNVAFALGAQCRSRRSASKLTEASERIRCNASSVSVAKKFPCRR